MNHRNRARLRRAAFSALAMAVLPLAGCTNDVDITKPADEHYVDKSAGELQQWLRQSNTGWKIYLGATEALKDCPSDYSRSSEVQHTIQRLERDRDRYAESLMYARENYYTGGTFPDVFDFGWGHVHDARVLAIDCGVITPEEVNDTTGDADWWDYSSLG